MRWIGPAILLAGLSAIAFGQQATPPIMNFLRVNPEICTGGQPTLEQIADLKKQGVTTIINLRTPQEFDAAPADDQHSFETASRSGSERRDSYWFPIRSWQSMVSR